MSRPLEAPILDVFWYKFWAKGWLGVDSFFVVSGYLISKRLDEGGGHLLRPEVGRFYVRRAARILPVFALVCLTGLACLAATPHGMPGRSVMMGLPEGGPVGLFWLSIATFWTNWYFLFLAVGSVGLQWGILWSLAIEEQFYLFYPMVLRLAGRLWVLGLFLGSVALMGLVASILAVKRVPWFNPGAAPYLGGFGLIAIGCLLFILWKRYRVAWAARGRGADLVAIMGLVVAAAFYARPQYKADFQGQMWGLTCFGLGVAVFLTGAMRWRWTESRWVRWSCLPGRLSYGMYLWHPMVMLALWPLSSRVGVLTGFALLVAGTLGVAVLSERTIEAPLNRAIRRRFGG